MHPSRVTFKTLVMDVRFHIQKSDIVFDYGG